MPGKIYQFYDRSTFLFIMKEQVQQWHGGRDYTSEQ